MSDDLMNGLLAYPSILVKQRPKDLCLQLCCGYEPVVQFEIYNPQQGNTKILQAKEESSCMARQCLGNRRCYEMKLTTIDDREVVVFKRPFRLHHGGPCCCCCEFGFQTVQVFGGAHSSNPNASLGYIRENYTFCRPSYSVINANNELIYKIIPNWCACRNWTFKIYDRHGGQESQEECGIIQQRWSGLAKEMFTDCQNFFITFPPNSNASERALLIGAMFLIDFLFFEDKEKSDQGMM